MRQIRRNARAKINLALDVVRKRQDGYHEVKMIMQTVELHDELTFEAEEKPGIRIYTNAGDIPANEDNLVYKAAKMLMDAYGIKEGLSVTIKKEIPVAAGMAGGSTDAAAAFCGVNELFELGLSKETLMEMAVQIGADVPYCILGGTALSEGIGEVLTPLPSPPPCILLIAKPDIYVSTKYVYENLRVQELKSHPQVDKMIEAIQNKDLAGMAALLENVLETVTEVKYPIIKEIKDAMKEKGAWNALMSGSGPTVFGIFEEEEEAQAAKEEIKRKGLAKQVFLSRFYEEG